LGQIDDPQVGRLIDALKLPRASGISIENSRARPLTLKVRRKLILRKSLGKMPVPD
jgi:hypothetical protein